MNFKKPVHMLDLPYRVMHATLTEELKEELIADAGCFVPAFVLFVRDNSRVRGARVRVELTLRRSRAAGERVVQGLSFHLRF